MDNNMKRRIMELLETYVPVYRKISHEEYAIRCPICGDSRKDLQKTRCYIKYSQSDTTPLMYMCFNCNCKGIVDLKFLKGTGIPSSKLIDVEDQIFNKLTRIKPITVDMVCGNVLMNSNQTNYIESRLGKGFEFSDYDKFKIVWDMSALTPCISDVSIRNTLPLNTNSISFLSEDKTMLITRKFGDTEPRWKKTRLIKSDNRSLYTIKSSIDLFSNDDIVVNIAEGVFDVLSIYKNFNADNSIFIATLGSSYSSGIEYAITTGLIGKNIIIKIYIDSDINISSVKYSVKKYKWLFKEIQLITNGVSKDVGVHIKDIELVTRWV